MKSMHMFCCQRNLVLRANYDFLGFSTVSIMSPPGFSLFWKLNPCTRDHWACFRDFIRTSFFDRVLEFVVGMNGKLAVKCGKFNMN